ncbi:MAG: hypothetical protein WBW93_21900, partial [Steroidobacteraceae bacterium]
MLARGQTLDQAELRAGYHATRSLWIEISGATDDTSVERMVRQRFCRQIAQPWLREIGDYQRGDELWLVFAQPFLT